MRKLELSNAGKWYIALTILIGVAAIISSNNIIYFTESLLLSGMLVSGILSEWAVRNITISKIEKQAIAGKACGDIIFLQNKSRLPAYCIEVGEWKDGAFHKYAFDFYLAAQSSKQVRSKQVFHERGLYRWNTIAVATSYPFGFARKIRVLTVQGERIVWPAMGGVYHAQLLIQKKSEDFDSIRLMMVGEDARKIVWPMSAKMQTPIVRQENIQPSDDSLILKVDGMREQALENAIINFAEKLYTNNAGTSLLCKFTLVENSKKEFFTKKKSALDRLALEGKNVA